MKKWLFLWNKTEISLQYIRIGKRVPVTEARLIHPFFKSEMEPVLHLVWRDNCLEITASERSLLKEKLRMTDTEVSRLEKRIYWEYASVVRERVYGASCTSLDYAFNFGRNLKLLRTGAGLESVRAAELLEIKEDVLLKIEMSKFSIDYSIGNCQEHSVLSGAAALFHVPMSELILQSLFYHVPVPYTIDL